MPVGLSLLGEDLHCRTWRQNTKIDFQQKRYVQCRSYFLVSSETKSHTFYQIFKKICIDGIEKIGEFPKNSPSNISGMGKD